MKTEEIEIKLPVSLIADGDYFVMTTNNASEKILGFPLCCQGTSIDDTTRKFWQMARAMTKYHESRSYELDRWKPLQVGQWKEIGGKWFMIFGINFHFRYGKHMKHGWFIPFTYLNISITNFRKKPVNK